jgi:NAD(P)-dependent dehydrogenase (short-subunit alcohol dehydrogenase family)
MTDRKAIEAMVAAAEGEFGHLDVLVNNSGIQHVAGVERIAALALFLCSASARSITGTVIPVDGGWTAR